MSASWNRAHEFGQPFTLIVIGRVEVRQAPAELGVEVAGAALGLDDGQLAELDAGAGHRAAPEDVRAGLQVDRLELGHQLRDSPFRHVKYEQLLLDRGADAARAVRLGQIGHLP